MPEKVAIMTGGPQSGFTFVGPFDFSTEAIEYADEEYRTDPWWVITLNAPDETEETAENQVNQMASALAISEGYDPNDLSVNDWAEAKAQYEGRARKVLEILASDQVLDDEESDPLEQPDEEIDDDS